MTDEKKSTEVMDPREEIWLSFQLKIKDIVQTVEYIQETYGKNKWIDPILDQAECIMESSESRKPGQYLLMTAFLEGRIHMARDYMADKCATLLERMNRHTTGLSKLAAEIDNTPKCPKQENVHTNCSAKQTKPTKQGKNSGGKNKWKKYEWVSKAISAIAQDQERMKKGEEPRLANPSKLANAVGKSHTTVIRYMNKHGNDPRNVLVIFWGHHRKTIYAEEPDPKPYDDSI